MSSAMQLEDQILQGCPPTDGVRLSRTATIAYQASSWGWVWVGQEDAEKGDWQWLGLKEAVSTRVEEGVRGQDCDFEANIAFGFAGRVVAFLGLQLCGHT